MEYFKILEGKKYMWDGEEYNTVSEADEMVTKYNAEDFQALRVEESGKYLVYTRREVTDIVVEGEL